MEFASQQWKHFCQIAAVGRRRSGDYGVKLTRLLLSLEGRLFQCGSDLKR